MQSVYTTGIVNTKHPALEKWRAIHIAKYRRQASQYSQEEGPPGVMLNRADVPMATPPAKVELAIRIGSNLLPSRWLVKKEATVLPSSAKTVWMMHRFSGAPKKLGQYTQSKVVMEYQANTAHPKWD